MSTAAPDVALLLLPVAAAAASAATASLRKPRSGNGLACHARRTPGFAELRRLGDPRLLLFLLLLFLEEEGGEVEEEDPLAAS